MKWLGLLLSLFALPVFAETAPVITNLTYVNDQGQILGSWSMPSLPTEQPAIPASKTFYSPKHKAMLESWGKPMAKKATTAGAAIFPQLPPYMLWWDYPVDQITNVVFEVYHSTALTNSEPLTRWDQIPSTFSLLSVVDQPPLYIGGLPQEFFIVRARDRVSGVVSNWNVK